MLVSETDYRLYITFYMQNIRNNTQTRVLALYGTRPLSAEDQDRPKPGWRSPMAPGLGRWSQTHHGMGL